jgi:hypothetical protein
MVYGVKNRMNFTCLDYHSAFVHSKMPDKFDVYIKAPYGIQVNENKVDKQEAKSKRKSCKFSLNQNVIVYYPNLIPKFYNGTIKAINDETVVVAYNLTHQVLFNQNMIHVRLFGNKELKGYMLLLLLCFFD